MSHDSLSRLNHSNISKYLFVALISTNPFMAISESTHGAGSPIMAEAVRRITTAFCDDSSTRDTELHASAVRKSFVLSVDMAHAVHPNYANKHEKNHGPKMNGGVVIKTNQNQRCEHSHSFLWF